MNVIPGMAVLYCVIGALLGWLLPQLIAVFSRPKELQTGYCVLWTITGALLSIAYYFN